jgi:hypothetical protein
MALEAQECSVALQIAFIRDQTQLSPIFLPTFFFGGGGSKLWQNMIYAKRLYFIRK